MIRNVKTISGYESHLTAGRKAVIEVMIKNGWTHAKSGRQEYTVETNPTGETTHRALITIKERRTIGDKVRLWADVFMFDHYGPEATQPAPLMVEGEGAPQYCLFAPENETQLVLF